MHEVFPKDLIDILEGNDPENISIVLTKVDHLTLNPKFDIQLTAQRFNDEDELVCCWTIEAEKHRNCRIALEIAPTIKIDGDHPIIWQFSDVQSELYFNGICSQPDKLFTCFYKIHRALFEDLIPFSSSIRDADSFDWLATCTHGLLAQGPKKLMIKYASQLEQYNLGHSIVGDRTPSYWDGEKHIGETGKAKVLFIGDSYIVADDFKFLQPDIN